MELPDLGRWEGVNAYWATMCIDMKRESWEAVSNELASKQEASLASRKDLTETYKAFRKLPEEEKLVSLGPVLKKFQEEIDALTRRSRLSEKSFLQVRIYRGRRSCHQGHHRFHPNFLQVVADFLDAPDPARYLLAGLEATRIMLRQTDELARSQSELRLASASNSSALADASVDRQRLEADVAELERELAKLRNQDITLREMETRIVDFEGTMEAQITARLMERENELRKVFETELEAVSFIHCGLPLCFWAPQQICVVQVREAETAAEARVTALQSALTDAVSSRDEAQVILLLAGVGVFYGQNSLFYRTAGCSLCQSFPRRRLNLRTCCRGRHPHWFVNSTACVIMQPG
jgi:hypothetical protein